MKHLIFLNSIVSKLLDKKIARLERAGNGANSCVYKVTTIDEQKYAVKVYRRKLSDKHKTRQENEKLAIELLNKSSVGYVPNFVNADFKNRVSIFEWVEGNSPKEIYISDIKQAASFFDKIFSLSHSIQTENFHFAAEPCLSGNEILRQIETRSLALTPEFKKNRFVTNYLNTKFFQKIDELINEGKRKALAAEISLEKEVGASDWKLIPADFSFQNSLRSEGGKLTFIDFEYFGWDDPIKGVCDFIFHPSYLMPYEHRDLFINLISEKINNSFLFKKKLHCFSYFFIARWALIMFNPITSNRLQFSDEGLSGEDKKSFIQQKSAQQIKTIQQYIDNQIEITECL